MNVLYDAFEKAMKGSAWKAGPQKFEKHYLQELAKLKREITERTYTPSKGSEFTLNERGHIRHIHGGIMRDRVIEHALCDAVLNPALEPYLMYYNGASQKGKGVSFTRKHFAKDLHNYYLEHGNNNGWVGIVDFSKFYDNIRHDKVKEMIKPLIDEESFWVFSKILDSFGVDVSYMSDEEYATCLERKYNSLEYYDNVTEEMKTGEKIMAKSVNIGNQISQSIGIYFPTPIDNYVTVVKGFDKFHRYMDDSALIHESRDYIEETIGEMEEQASRLGIFMNRRKTRIVRMSDVFVFLQRKYFVTDTGKVVTRITPKAITRERRRIKAYKRLCDREVMSYPDVEQAVKSWMGGNVNDMSKEQIKNMKNLYKELFGKELTWKKQR